MGGTTFDYLIVGAGPSGLCAAKTILQCEPHADIKILDSNQTLGGVWASENIYLGLKTNNVFGQLDFSDFPMDSSYGVSPGEHVTGQAMHAYLEAYARRSQLHDLIDFGTYVVEIVELDNHRGWKLKTTSAAAGEREFETAKLLIATGVTNKPHRPVLPGADDFDGPVIHSAEMGTKGGELINSDAVRTVAVLGGGKSAYDAVHFAASEGRQVDWIMRKSGKGPEWVFPSHTMIGPFKALRERLTTRRFISFFSPCIFKDGFDGFRYFFHFTRLGKAIAQKFWANIHQATLRDCGMRNAEATKALEPEQNPFWYGTASGVYSYTSDPQHDIYALVKSSQVRIHREDISRLTSHAIHFASGNTIPADALITATGFSAKPTLSFFPPAIHSSLGVPSTQLTSEQTAFWDTLDRRSDDTLRASFPRLLTGPFHSPSSTIVQPYHADPDPQLSYTPFRLYRAIAPPGPTASGIHTLAFISMFSNLANTPRCELQCLWAYAYLTDRLHVLDPTRDNADPSSRSDAVYAEASLLSRFCKWRAPYGHGRHFPDLVFDQLPYMDTLLRDLGLRWKRKGGFLRELFAPYTAADYRGCVAEWCAREGIKDVKLDGGARA